MLSRLLFRHRKPWQVCGFDIVPDRTATNAALDVVLSVAIGSELVEVWLPREFALRLVATLGTITAQPCDEALAILAELALEPALTGVDQMLDGRRPASCPPASNDLRLGFRCSDEQATFPAVLRLRASAQAGLAQLLRTEPRCVAPCRPVAMPLSIRIGAADLLARDLRTLRCGDVIMPWDGDLHQGVTCVVAEHLSWSGTLHDGSVTLTTRAATLPQAGIRGIDMDGLSKLGQEETTVEASLNDLPIRVIFEVGRVEMALGELSAMGPGYVIPVGRPASAIVDILAHGRRIGQGEIVAIGDDLGVRLLRLAAE